MTMLNTRFIRRQLTSAWQQSAIFILSVSLAMVSLVALRGLGDSINRALLSDAKELQAADIFVESNFALSEATSAEIEALVRREHPDLLPSERATENYIRKVLAWDTDG